VLVAEAAAYGTQPDRAYELHPHDIGYFASGLLAARL
jgi:hypothetical protein